MLPPRPIQQRRWSSTVVPAWAVDAHRLVPVSPEEEVAVVGRDDRARDACRGQLPDGAREVVDDGVHHLARLEGEAGLARVVDLLRPDDHDLGTFDPLRELRG